MNLPLIFCDFDGVINDHEPHANGYCGTNPECVANLNRILAETDAMIVVSSAWRYLVHQGAMTIKGLEHLLATHGVAIHDRILDITCTDEELEPRGKQIRHWLNENGGDRRYVVVDDLDLGISEAGHPFVRTDGQIGLTAADANMVIFYLGGGKTAGVESEAAQGTTP